MNRAKSIVAGIDFTPCSVSALRQSIRISNWNRARLQVVHAISPDVASQLESALGHATENVRAGLLEDAQREWSRLR